MIHDAKVEVTCDGKGCYDGVQVEPEFVYSGMSESSGRYDTSDKAIERKLGSEHEWIVDDGKHYCCVACAGRR